MISNKCSSSGIVIQATFQHYKTGVDQSLTLYWYVSSLYVICYIM